MKCVADRPFANPEAAARKLIELANTFEPGPGWQDPARLTEFLQAKRKRLG